MTYDIYRQIPEPPDDPGPAIDAATKRHNDRVISANRGGDYWAIDAEVSRQNPRPVGLAHRLHDTDRLDYDPYEQQEYEDEERDPPDYYMEGERE